MQQRTGGGFLAGAAQTAMGVAGGVLLGNAIAGMLGGNEAQAAQPAAPAPEPEAPVDDMDFGGDEDI
jgi:membrane protease subunit (stomatin/prohibitin family)